MSPLWYKYILKEAYENISGLIPPTYLFIYSKNSEELRNLFKNEYKENTMNIKVLEKDIKQMDKDYLTKNKINKKTENFPSFCFITFSTSHPNSQKHCLYRLVPRFFL